MVLAKDQWMTKNPRKIAELKLIVKLISIRRGVVVIGLLLAVVIVTLGVLLSKDNSQPAPDSKCVTKGSKGAVATDDERCSDAGLYVLEKGGNAVDAAVASLLCLGVVNFQSSGIGGGLMMLVAKKNTSAPEGYTVTVIDAREVAPRSAQVGDYLPVNKSGKNINMTTGTLSIAIPGELRGMEMALELFSNNTKDKRAMIFKKAIEIAEQEFLPSWHLLNATEDEDHGIERFEKNPTFNYENLRNLVKSIIGERQVKPRVNYTNTLKMIMEKGFQEFYTGPTAASLVDDINKAFCMQFPSNCSSPRITMEDLKSYRAIKRNPLQFSITGSAKVMYTAPAPASGSALALFLKLMQGRVSQGADDAAIYHYLLEASKFSNSHLMDLGDPKFNQTAHVAVDDVNRKLEKILKYEALLEYAHNETDLEYYNYMAGPSESNFGTTHVVVATYNGDVVTVTSSINDYFGSGFVSSSTGVILNDQMDDFYVPRPQDIDRFPHNHVEGGKRPLSAATPAIMIDSNGNLRLALGASGGRRIPPAVGQSAFFIVNRGESIEDGIERARVYATLDDCGKRIVERVEKPGINRYGLSREIQDELNSTYRHYNLTDYTISVVQGIELQGNTFCAYSDPRKGGMAAAYG